MLETFIVGLLSWFVGPWWDQTGSSDHYHLNGFVSPSLCSRLKAPRAVLLHFFSPSRIVVVVFGLWVFSPLVSSSYPANFGHALEPPP